MAAAAAAAATTSDADGSTEFVFFDGDEESARVLVATPSASDLGRYGLYTWRSAEVLGWWVWRHRLDAVAGKTVLELGAGTGLPGLLAAAVGATRVVLTDRSDASHVLDNCAAGYALNGLGPPDVTVAPLDWGFFDPAFDALPAVDVVLGADVFYEPDDFEDAVVTATELLRRGPLGARFVTTYQNRSPDRSLEPHLHRHGLQCAEVPLRTVYPEHRSDEAELDNETIHLLVLTVAE